MVKNYLYLNILFIFGLIVYLLSQNFNFELKSTFYLFFGLFSIFISGLFLLTDFKFKSNEEKKSYSFLFLGFLVYGMGNWFWYLNEKLNLNISVEYLNLFFIFQVFSKDYFLRYLSMENLDKKPRKIFGKVYNVYLLIIIFTLFAGRVSFFGVFLDDYLFLFESLVSIIFLFYFNSKINLTFIDLSYFLIGSLIWFFADLLFMFESSRQVYLMGDLSDFIYYLGFYFMLSAVMFKNFNLTRNLNLKLDTSLRFS